MKNSEQSEYHQQGECATANDMLFVCMCECVCVFVSVWAGHGERETWEKEEGVERAL